MFEQLLYVLRVWFAEVFEGEWNADFSDACCDFAVGL